MNPRIVSAANRFILEDGIDIIIPSARHWDPLMMRIIMALSDRLSTECQEQGFIDQYGNFHSREDAWIIAKENNQIIHRVGGDTANGGRLFSENLY